MTKRPHPSEAFKDQAIAILSRERDSHGVGTNLRYADIQSTPAIQRQTDAAIRLTCMALYERECRNQGEAFGEDNMTRLSEALADYQRAFVFRNTGRLSKGFDAIAEHMDNFIGFLRKELHKDAPHVDKLSMSAIDLLWQAQRAVHRLHTPSALHMENRRRSTAKEMNDHNFVPHTGAEIIPPEHETLYAAEIALVAAMIAQQDKVRQMTARALSPLELGRDFLDEKKVGDALQQAAQTYYDAYRETKKDSMASKDEPSTWQVRLAQFIDSAQPYLTSSPSLTP